MQFRVAGKSRSTGQPVEITIETVDAQAACILAEANDVLDPVITPVGSEPDLYDIAPPQPTPPIKTPPSANVPPGFPAIKVSEQPASRPAFFRRMLLAAILPAAAAAAAVLTVVFLPASSGGFRAARSLPTSRPTFVNYLSVDHIRQTEFWHDLFTAAERERQPLIGGLKFDIADIAERTIAVDQNASELQLIRTRADLDLHDLLIDPRGAAGTVDGCEFMRGEGVGGTVYVASLGPRLFGIMRPGSGGEQFFKNAIARFKDQTKPQTDDAFRLVSSFVDSCDFGIISRTASNTSAGGAAAASPKASAVGLEIGGTVKLRAIYIFSNADQASVAAKNFEEADAKAGDRTPQAGTIDAAAKLVLTGLSIKQKDNELRLTAAWPYADIRRACAGDPRLFLQFVQQLAR